MDAGFNETALSLLEDLVSFRRMNEALNAKALGNHMGVPAGNRKVQVSLENRDAPSNIHIPFSELRCLLSEVNA